MSQTDNQQPTTDRERAIVEAGRLIDALTDGNGDLVKDCWYALSKCLRPALAEIRQHEPPQPHWTDKEKGVTR